MKDDSARQADALFQGGSESLADQLFELVDGVGEEFRHLRERWDNRLILEQVSLAEAYRRGDVELAIYFDWRTIGGDKIKGACRIVAESASMELVGGDKAPSDKFDVGDDDRGSDEVVLVLDVERPDAPKFIPTIVLGTYLFENEVFGTGQGLLYRLEPSRGYKVFPRFGDGEVWVGFSVFGADYAGSQVIQCSPKIVDRISDDEAQRLWDWLYGPVGQLPALSVRMGRSDLWLGFDREQVVAQRVCGSDQFVNVALGPLNL